MAGYYGAIRSSEGVAIITESGEQNTRETGHYKINERVSIIIVYGYKTAIRFCEERLKHLSHENDPVKITSEIKKQMEEHKNSNRAPFSAIITGFISPHLTFYFAVWMNGDKPIRLEPLPTASVFSDPAPAAWGIHNQKNLLAALLNGRNGAATGIFNKTLPECGTNFQRT